MQAPSPQPMLEREAELGRVEGAIAAAADGRGQLVVVEAAAGLGKTRLLQAALAIARRRNFATLSARGVELEREFPFGVVRQLLEPALAAAARPRRDALFTGAAALARPLFESNSAAAAPSAIDGTHAILHGLYWLLANLAGNALMALAIDDLHWCDPSSLRFVGFLLPRLEELPFVMLVSLRPGEVVESPLAARVAGAPAANTISPASAFA